MFSLKASATPDQDVHRLSPGAGGLATSMVRGCRWLARLGRSGDINGPRMWLAGPAREGRRHQWSADVVGGPGAGGAAILRVRGCGWRARRGRGGDINGPRMWLAGPAREGRRHQWSADVVGGPDAGGPAMRALRTI